jgi:hypothetical protein
VAAGLVGGLAGCASTPGGPVGERVTAARVNATTGARATEETATRTAWPALAAAVGLDDGRCGRFTERSTVVDLASRFGVVTAQ